jgi:phage/plasmid-associated DNA primase
MEQPSVPFSFWLHNLNTPSILASDPSIWNRLRLIDFDGNFVRDCGPTKDADETSDEDFMSSVD